MKPTILLQLDSDIQTSVFDAVVAIDVGVENLLRHGGVRPDQVRDLVHGALFTRGPGDLHRTAIFLGGSDVARGEVLLQAVKDTFFGSFRVSVMLDANGSNTTAAAAVLAAIEGAETTLGAIDGAQVGILGGTGPVGQRVARLLLGLDGDVKVRIGSRSIDKAQATVEALERTTGRTSLPFMSADPSNLAAALDEVDVVIAAGAAGTRLLPKSVRSGLSRLKVAIDLNAVPPLGVEGVEATDKATDRDGVLAWGALGVGGTKMKIHKAALRSLFESNDRVIDAEECLAIGRSLA